jgi:signal transduction histidine kinase
MSGNVSILLAEDDQAVSRSLAEYLLSLGYFVTEARTGLEALGYFRELLPHLVITDLQMPELGGLKLLEIVKSESEFTPCIIVSGQGTMQDVIEGLRIGAWDYLVKPINPLELLQHSVERALERARLLREARTHQEYLEIAVEQRTATLLLQNRQLETEVAARRAQEALVIEARNEWERSMKEKEVLHAQLLQAHKLESVGQLASGIAHEINTPTQFVSSNVSFLEGAFTDVRNLVATLVNASSRTQLTGDTLSAAMASADWPYLESEIPLAIKQSQEGLSRITHLVRAMKEFSHPGNKENEQVDINHLINTTVTVARNEWKYSAEIQLDLDPNLPGIFCLAGEIGQVLLNLLVNAAHAISEKIGRNPEGGKGLITIKTEIDGPSVFIHITDSGCGIPDFARAKIFDPFFTTKEVGRGTGQGLAIAYDVVTHKHGGTLTFSSVVGEGTTFTIKLPVEKGAVVEGTGE